MVMIQYYRELIATVTYDEVMFFKELGVMVNYPEVEE